jgi:hypothetical protein
MKSFMKGHSLVNANSSETWEQVIDISTPVHITSLKKMTLTTKMRKIALTRKPLHVHVFAAISNCSPLQVEIKPHNRVAKMCVHS